LWGALKSAPRSQFPLARARWDINSISHYRMAANYGTNLAQCYYDVEVWQERIVHVFSATCLSNAETNMLTIGGIFEYFEAYATKRVCSPNGCYCEGSYTVRATYDPTLGYPQRITTFFRRNWLDDLLHGKLGIQQCL